MYYLGALTLEKATNPSQVQLRIPNRISRREYFVELQHIFSISQPILPKLETAVTQMHSGDIEPLCQFIMGSFLNLQQHNNVVHSMENTLKSVFILAVAIARGPDVAFSEYDLVNTQADAVFLLSSGSGVHIEFKNTAIGQISGWHNDRDWSMMNQRSDEVYYMTDEQIMKLPLQFQDRNPLQNKQMRTVSDMWEYVLGQTKQAKILLEKKVYKPFVSYAVYRVGLRRLFWARVESDKAPVRTLLQ